MQDFLGEIGNGLELLLKPGQILQIAMILMAIFAATWLGGRIRGSRYARAVVAQSGLRPRLAEAALIVSPHFIALVLIGGSSTILRTLGMERHIVDPAFMLAGLMLFIRFSVYIVRLMLSNRTRGWGNVITIIVWSLVSLHVLGWSDPVVQVLDGIGITVGSTKITLWSVVKVLFSVSAFILVAAWITRRLERRLLALPGLALNMRIGIAKFLEVFLIGLSIVLGLDAAGLDLTTLTVLTGAVGIGLGFGLQAITANFVSGFVLLMDRSIKPGDVISFTGTTGTSTEGFGWVQELRGRYIVVRDRDGVETLVPNQHLITNPVINWGFTDTRVRLKLPVRVSYNDDPEKAMALLLQAAQGHPRILRDPQPATRLMGFNDYGFDLELRFWISDPKEGVNNVRSDVNRVIWRLFIENRVTIPVAQREVLVRVQDDNDRSAER